MIFFPKQIGPITGSGSSEKYKNEDSVAPKNILSSFLGKIGTSHKQVQPSVPLFNQETPGGRHWLDRKKESQLVKSHWTTNSNSNLGSDLAQEKKQNLSSNSNSNSNFNFKLRSTSGPENLTKPEKENEKSSGEVEEEVQEGKSEVIFADIIVKKEASRKKTLGEKVEIGPNFKKFKKV